MTDLQKSLAQVDAAANEVWKKAAREAIELCAWMRPNGFTPDDVLDALDAVPHIQTHDKRALGPLMLAAKVAGIIEPIKCHTCGQKIYTESTRPSQHKNVIVTYRRGPNAKDPN